MLKTLESWFVLLSLWFLMGNPINVLLYGEGGDQIVENVQGSFLEPSISMAIYSLSLVFILVHWKQVLQQFKQGNLLVWGVVVLAVVSTSWSDYPDITSRRALIGVGATLFGTYFATCFSFREQLQFLAIAFLAIALMSFGFGALLPKYGQMHVPPHAGSWRGIFMHKQGLGAQMTMNSAFFLALLQSDVCGKGRKLPLFGLGLSVMLLLASRSSTGLISFIVLASVLAICQVRRFKMDLRIISLLILAIALSGGALVLADHTEAIVGTVGKDLTFSGRDQLWASLWEMVSRRPIWGYGYEAFWQGRFSQSALIWQVVGWSAPHAHNGFLDLMLALGWVGLSLFMVTLVINTGRVFQLITANGRSEAFAPLLILLYIILSNLTEKNLLGAGAVWILYVWVCFLPTKATVLPLLDDRSLYSSCIAQDDRQVVH